MSDESLSSDGCSIKSDDIFDEYEKFEELRAGGTIRASVSRGVLQAQGKGKGKGKGRSKKTAKYVIVTKGDGEEYNKYGMPRDRERDIEKETDEEEPDTPMLDRQTPERYSPGYTPIDGWDPTPQPKKRHLDLDNIRVRPGSEDENAQGGEEEEPQRKRRRLVRGRMSDPGPLSREPPLSRQQSQSSSLDIHPSPQQSPSGTRTRSHSSGPSSQSSFDRRLEREASQFWTDDVLESGSMSIDKFNKDSQVHHNA
ncbi:hypothetical protein DL93DRAFT_2227623 [Clavulina sp. PMI_390]|nr:hypothetical protein DL93DRAFT_2227623 [Clavulina sp. PMI_390]